MSFGANGTYIKPFRIPDEDREKWLRAFRKNVVISITGCWEWIGRIHNGYGTFNGKWAHRVSYALFNGPIEENRQIDHTCRNRTCTNPSHLRQVTASENCLAIYRRQERDRMYHIEDFL